MIRLVFVMIGGALGSAARYLVAGAVQRQFGASFPWGTLAVNLVGCGVIGFLMNQSRIVDGGLNARLLLVVGVCGGFTTFSSFGYETLELLRDGEPQRALLNVSLQLVGGLAAVWVGLVAARMLERV
jgi:CrcB protein